MRVNPNKYLKAAQYVVLEGLGQYAAFSKAKVCSSPQAATKAAKNQSYLDEVKRLQAASISDSVKSKEEKLIELANTQDKVNRLQNMLLDRLIKNEMAGNQMSASDKTIMSFLDKFAKMHNTAGVRDDKLQGHNVSEEENPQNEEVKKFNQFFLAAQKSTGYSIKQAQKVPPDQLIETEVEIVEEKA